MLGWGPSDSHDCLFSVASFLTLLFAIIIIGNYNYMIGSKSTSFA